METSSNDFMTQLGELEKELEEINKSGDTKIKKAERAIEASVRHLKRLRVQIVNTSFTSISEEIHFFKHVKPLFASRLNYYVSVFNIETLRPDGTLDMEKQYLVKQLEKTHEFYSQRREFIQYYQLGFTEFDSRFFVRGQDMLLYFDLCSYTASQDERFSTSHDHLVANILANDLLKEYLKNELDKLDKSSNHVAGFESPSKWTDKKADAVELIYSIYAAGSIDNGKAEIQWLAGVFQKMFNVELPHLSKTYKEIRSRKGQRIRYLHHLISSLEKKMDEDDDNWTE